MQSFVNTLTIMQGIYKGYPVMGFGTKMPLHNDEFSENPLKKAALHVESQNNIVPKPQ
jgi:hypothetical protein